MLSDLLYRLRALFRRKSMEAELDEELRAHVEHQVEKYIQSGLTREEAARRARLEFGGLDQVKEGCRDARGVNFIETLIQDVRYGLRMLRKNPGFTAVAVITLALGIGANTAIFSMVNAVVLRPLPYPHSDRLVWIREVIPALKAEATNGVDYLDWRDQNQSLESMTAYDPSISFNLTGRGTPLRVPAAMVSSSFFATFGVNPRLGRGFTAEEDRPNGPNVVILMNSLWQQYFGSDPNVLGQTLTLNAAPYTVVGVMPASFRFPGEAALQVLVPLVMNQAQQRLRVQVTLVNIIGRLKPDVTLARAESDLDAIRERAQPAAQAAAQAAGPQPVGGAGSGPSAGGGSMTHFMPSSNASRPTGRGSGAQPPRQLMGGPEVGRAAGGPPGREQFVRPASGAAGPAPAPSGSQSPPPGGGPRAISRVKDPEWVQLKVVTLAEHLAENLRPAMLTLLGVVGLVLLIACANVANLMLVRASARTREIAVRAALGAGRGRLIRQMLSESLLLALCGGLAGLLVASSGVKVMTSVIPASIGADILSLSRPRVDSHVLLYSLAVSLATGILFGLVPALAATRMELSEQLKEGVQAASAGPRRGLLEGVLVVAELSLALVLLIGAGLLGKSFYRVLSIDPGFAPERVLTLNLSLSDSKYPKPEQERTFFSEVLRRVESLPGVRSAALADSLPLSPYGVRTAVLIRPDMPVVMMFRLVVSPGYFYTLGIPVLRGRTFTDWDNDRSPKVAVVNETLARSRWAGEDPLGKELDTPGGGLSVIGVVRDSRHESLSDEVESEVYVPYLQEPLKSMQLAVRSVGDPASVASAVRDQVAAIDPEQPIYHVTTLEQTLSETVAPRRFNVLLLGIFAAIALALAPVGIYGVMAFSVTQRTHEIGIRMALGAERRDVLWMVLSEVAKMALLGVGIGLVAAIGLTRLLANMLFGVTAHDPLTFAGVAGLLTLVALAACYIPARRATKVDPMVALRYE